jgi:hypothetical protein
MESFFLKTSLPLADTDTVVITAIGYYVLYEAFGQIKNRAMIYINANISNLSPVVVVASRKSTTLGKIPKHGTSLSMGWGNDGQGGEAVMNLKFRLTIIK